MLVLKSVLKFDVGFRRDDRNLLKTKMGATGLEPMTPTVSR